MAKTPPMSSAESTEVAETAARLRNASNKFLTACVMTAFISLDGSYPSRAGGFIGDKRILMQQTCTYQFEPALFIRETVKRKKSMIERAISVSLGNGEGERDESCETCERR